MIKRELKEKIRTYQFMGPYILKMVDTTKEFELPVKKPIKIHEACGDVLEVEFLNTETQELEMRKISIAKLVDKYTSSNKNQFEARLICEDEEGSIIRVISSRFIHEFEWKLIGNGISVETIDTIDENDTVIKVGLSKEEIKMVLDEDFHFYNIKRGGIWN